MESRPDHGTCAAVAGDLAELALGTLSGRERAGVIAHLERCERCAAELDRLTGAVDAVALLAPEVDPPAGFASRTVRAMAANEGRRHVRPLAAAVAACVVALGVGVGVGALATHPGQRSTSEMIDAALVSPNGIHGQVVLSKGPTAWLLLALDDAPIRGTVTCTVTLRDGSVRSVGTFAVHPGYDAWTGWVDAPATEVKTVNVYDSSGMRLASAAIGA